MIDFLWDNIWITLLVLNYFVVLIIAIFIIRHNRNPVSTLSYILSMLIFPVVGWVVYLFIGQEYRKEKMFKREGVFSNIKIQEWERKLLLSTEQLYEKVPQLSSKLKLVELLQNNQKKPLTFNNTAKILINGERKFKALFEDIAAAKHHIHVEYYIFNSDKIGGEFIENLCKKSQQGLEVRVSYDYVASEISQAAIEKLKAAGVEIFPFMPVRFPNLTRRLNYRNHCKIVVIDGRIGYVGGVNVADEYINPGKKGTYWRDTHLRLEGDAVKSLQAQFILNWNFVSEEELHIKDAYFPVLEQCGNKAVQIASSGPDSDWANIMEAIFVAIATAQQSVFITTPYFIPNEQILTAIKTASRGGVAVSLLVPQNGDSWITKYAGDSYILELLESGVQVLQYQKGMIHAKTMVVDETLCLLGTANMDYRSFEINFETNALIYDAGFAKKMQNIFEEDRKESSLVTLENWSKRPRINRWKESICRLWAPLL